jgi:hypothetical protein
MYILKDTTEINISIIHHTAIRTQASSINIILAKMIAVWGGDVSRPGDTPGLRTIFNYLHA